MAKKGLASQGEMAREEEEDAERPGESTKNLARGGGIHGKGHDGGHHGGHSVEHHPHHRAKGGGVPTEADEEGKEDKETKVSDEGPRREFDEHERKRGGAMPEHMKRHKRARGGKVPGMKAKAHPGRRARGGATADLSPYTAAGRMSEPSYESGKAPGTEAGRGMDSSGPYRS